MTSEAIIDELTYRSYAWNRQLSPHIAPERWSVLFGAEATAAMEERFQEWLTQGAK